MTNQTKLDLETSLKRLLKKKPLERITIGELVEECGVSRMTFYYHFRDIHDLVEWSCLRGVAEGLQGIESWEERLKRIFGIIYQDRTFVLGLNRTVSREQSENFLCRLFCGLICELVEAEERTTALSEGEKKFRIEFYTYGCVKITQDWILDGMQRDPQQLAGSFIRILKRDFVHPV